MEICHKYSSFIFMYSLRGSRKNKKQTLSGKRADSGGLIAGVQMQAVGLWECFLMPPHSIASTIK